MVQLFATLDLIAACSRKFTGVVILKRSRFNGLVVGRFEERFEDCLGLFLAREFLAIGLEGSLLDSEDKEVTKGLHGSLEVLILCFFDG